MYNNHAKTSDREFRSRCSRPLPEDPSGAPDNGDARLNWRQAATVAFPSDILRYSFQLMLARLGPPPDPSRGSFGNVELAV